MGYNKKNNFLQESWRKCGREANARLIFGL